MSWTKIDLAVTARQSPARSDVTPLLCPHGVQLADDTYHCLDCANMRLRELTRKFWDMRSIAMAAEACVGMLVSVTPDWADRLRHNGYAPRHREDVECVLERLRTDATGRATS